MPDHDFEFDAYQEETRKTVIYDNDEIPRLAYATLGLVGEAGEVAEKVKKIFRDGGGLLTPEAREALAKELGDVLWYLARVADESDLPLSVIAATNIRKLQARRLQGVLTGSGDDR